jgi:DNA-binding transcriptional LysR family regulator
MDTWPFRRGGELDRVRIDGPLSASTVDAVRAACIAGVGIAMMTYWDVYEQIEREELKRIVLADAEPDELGIWAVFPTRRHMPVRVRAFIDALRERLLAGRSLRRKALLNGPLLNRQKANFRRLRTRPRRRGTRRKASL